MEGDRPIWVVVAPAIVCSPRLLRSLASDGCSIVATTETFGSPPGEGVGMAKFRITCSDGESERSFVDSGISTMPIPKGPRARWTRTLTALAVDERLRTVTSTVGQGPHGKVEFVTISGLFQVGSTPSASCSAWLYVAGSGRSGGRSTDTQQPRGRSRRSTLHKADGARRERTACMAI